MSLPSRIKRWWRSKGFGIHSPFAFYFVTRVLREPLPYYAYPDIERIAFGSSIPSRELKLLFRIVCHFSPAEITLPSGTPGEVAETLRLADSRVKIVADATDFQYYHDVCDDGGEEFRRRVRHVLDGDGVIVLRGAGSLKRELTDSMPYGMTFTDGNILIAVSRRDLPRQDFEVEFLP